MAFKIKRDSCAIIERVIRRYPETKAMYEDEVERILHSTPQQDGQPHGSGTGNPTEQKALKMLDPRVERISREVSAVEKAYAEIPDDHKKVIRVRFWTDKRKNMPYIWMQASVSYSERQMHRIVFSFIEKVGKNLGEL